MSLRFTILGCGSSGGVPRVGPSGWGACDPAEPKNRRRRCALLVERLSPNGRTVVLVDAGPDLRDQLLGAAVTHLDAILMTHAHADHLHGIDDVRPLVISMRKRIPVYMDAPTTHEVRAKFGYVIETPPGSQYPPLVDARKLVPGQLVSIDGPGGRIDAMPLRFEHGDIDALGFRFGDVLYSPDLSAVPSETEAGIRDLSLWIIDALRYTPHPSHITVARALELIRETRCKRAILTNLHTDLDYAALAFRLPANVSVAYDGRILDCPI